jgi:hypothetical protein
MEISMNMNKRIAKMVATLVLASAILSACGIAAPAEPTQDPNAVFTQVAETVMVSMTQTAEAMPPTPTPEPTATMAPTLPPIPTVDPLATQAVPPTQQPIGPTATTQRYGDSAQYNTQTPVDGKVFKKSEEFQFIVCFGNNGSTTWDKKYYLEWVNGFRLWSNEKYFYVGEEVKPGGKWCFYTPAVAPHSSGPYTTRWYMKNGDGEFMHEVYFTYSVE